MAVGVDSDANLGGTAGEHHVALTAGQNSPHNLKYTSWQTNNDNIIGLGQLRASTVIQVTRTRLRAEMVLLTKIDNQVYTFIK